MDIRLLPSEGDRETSTQTIPNGSRGTKKNHIKSNSMCMLIKLENHHAHLCNRPHIHNHTKAAVMFSISIFSAGKF